MLDTQKSHSQADGFDRLRNSHFVKKPFYLAKIVFVIHKIYEGTPMLLGKYAFHHEKDPIIHRDRSKTRPFHKKLV
jgi:hypothetical protein